MDTAFPSCFAAVIPRWTHQSPAEVCRVDPVGFTWHSPSYLHITLCYVDWLTRDEFERAQAVIPADFPQHVELTGELAVVGDERRRSLVAPLMPDPALLSLREKLSQDLTDLGCDVSQPFRPHMTVARVAPGRLPDVSAWGIEPIRLEIREIGLYHGGTTLRRPLTAN